MKITVNRYMFRRQFEIWGRNDSYSYHGLDALFDYLDARDEDCGIESELYVQDICGNWDEYDNFEEFQKAYSDGFDYENIEDIEGTVISGYDGEKIIVEAF